MHMNSDVRKYHAYAVWFCACVFSVLSPSLLSVHLLAELVLVTRRTCLWSSNYFYVNLVKTRLLGQIIQLQWVTYRGIIFHTSLGMFQHVFFLLQA